MDHTRRLSTVAAVAVMWLLKGAWRCKSKPAWRAKPGWERKPRLVRLACCGTKAEGRRTPPGRPLGEVSTRSLSQGAREARARVDL